MPAGARDPELLLAHAVWLRRLAQRLVGDGALADELVQDTWVAALRRPPDVDRPVRPWLRHVAKNLARLRWRGEAHRTAREQTVAAAGEATPSSHELIERHETQQLLARLVAELDEPFRTTILLCYGGRLRPDDRPVHRLGAELPQHARQRGAGRAARQERRREDRHADRHRAVVERCRSRRGDLVTARGMADPLVALQRDGYVILENALDGPAVAELVVALAPLEAARPMGRPWCGSSCGSRSCSSPGSPCRER